MGKLDLGLTFAEKCAISFRTSGTTLLHTKPRGKINIEGLRYAPKQNGDVVNFSCLRKPSVKRLKELQANEGLNKLALRESNGKVMLLGELDDACYITDNNSLFLERLVELFPKKSGCKVNTDVQKRMLYLQDINHSNFTNKEEFLQKFLKDIDEVENIKRLEGGQLYGDDVVSLYSKKAILQAKYNNPERYSDLTNLLMLYQKGLIPRHNVSTFFPEGQVHKLIKSDMQKLLSGESYYPQFAKISEQEIAKLELGEVFSIGEKMFVKTKEGYEVLKIDKTTYEKLFPAVERYSISQNGVGNCGKIATWNAMIKNPNSRIELYKMFEQTEQGVIVRMPRKGYISEYQWNDLSALNTSENLQGSLGHKMLEYTYDVNKMGTINTIGDPKTPMVEDILGLPNLKIDGYDFLGNDAKIKEFCTKYRSGIFVKNEGEYNLNKGQTSEHYYSSTDLSKGIWQNPWTGIEELNLGFDICSSGILHVL